MVMKIENIRKKIEMCFRSHQTVNIVEHHYAIWEFYSFWCHFVGFDEIDTDRESVVVRVENYLVRSRTHQAESKRKCENP